MKSFSIILVCIITLQSCENYSNNELIGDKADITSSTRKWLNYQWKYIEWHKDYTAFNTDKKAITKIDFLKELCTGTKIPMRLNKADVVAYILQDLNLKRKVDREIGEGLSSTCYYKLKLAEMEGKKLPDFNWTSINGEKMTNETLLTATLVINTWFLNCLPCKQEIPQLNKIIETYKNKSNIKFIALSFDPKNKVEHFLQKTPFYYIQVPEQESYLKTKLGIQSYPTHLVIINDTIVKALNDPYHLEDYLKSIVTK